MTAKWKKRVAAGVGCLAAAVLLTNLLCRVVFLNPVRRQEEILQTLSLNIQTLCPQVTYLYIQPAQADGWFNFSRYTQYLFVTESYHTNENMKDGIFRYALGRMTVEENPLRDRQDSVLLRRELETDALTFFEEVSAEKRYQIVCRTEEALTIEEIFREAERLWGQENNALVRILIDSGEGEEEPVLGIPGNGCYTDVSMDRASPGMHKVLFMGNLKYLDDHPEECQVLFESGLLREGCRVDYGERLNYIRDQGLSCIGLTASVTGEELLRMREDCPLFTVIQAEEDEKERPSLP